MIKCDKCKKKVEMTISVMTDHPFAWLGMGIEQYCFVCLRELIEYKDKEG